MSVGILQAKLPATPLALHHRKGCKVVHRRLLELHRRRRSPPPEIRPQRRLDDYSPFLPFYEHTNRDHRVLELNQDQLAVLQNLEHPDSGCLFQPAKTRGGS